MKDPIKVLIVGINGYGHYYLKTLLEEVACEKPICALTDEAESLIEKRDKSGKFVMIGFQWSYSEGIQSLKKDILSGKFGRPVRMKSLCLWPREFSYFSRNNWAYRKADSEGNVVMDNLFNNAMSHFIHNMFFLLGDAMETSAEAENIEAQIAKAYPVETYDTGTFRAFTKSGVELLFLGSHVAEKKVDPCFRIEFEKGFVELKSGADKIIAKTLDKKEFTYPSPDSDHQFKKLFIAIDNVIKPGKIICTPDAAISQTKLANAVDKLCRDAKMFPEKLIIKTNERLFVKGLDDLFLSGYKDYKLIKL